MPVDKPLTLVSYESADPLMAFVEPVAVGDLFPDMPLFLQAGKHVNVPLEATYAATWLGTPAPIRRQLEAVRG